MNSLAPRTKAGVVAMGKWGEGVGEGERKRYACTERRRERKTKMLHVIIRKIAPR